MDAMRRKRQPSYGSRVVEFASEVIEAVTPLLDQGNGRGVPVEIVVEGMALAMVTVIGIFREEAGDGNIDLSDDARAFLDRLAAMLARELQ
jgi:hypothetical protein